MRPRLAVFLLASTLLATSARADESQNRATARSLAQEGKEALERKDFVAAEDRFARADALMHAPTLLLFLARAQVGRGKLVAAAESYRRILREGAPAGSPEQFTKAVEDAKSELAAIEPRIAWVTIVISPATSAKVAIDGVEVPAAALGARWAIDPGAHEVRVMADGFAEGDARFEVPEGGSKQVGIDLHGAPSAAAVGKHPAPQPATPPPRSSTQKTVGVVALAAGGAGLVFGGVTGGLSLSKHGALVDGCPNATCPSGQHDALTSYRLMTTLSTVGFIAGGVLAAGGVVLLLTAPGAAKKERAVTVSPYLGAASAGLTGRF